MHKGVEAICERSKYFSHREELKQYIDREVDLSEFMEIQHVVQHDNLIKKTMEAFQASSDYSVSVMQMYYDYISPFMQIYQ